MMPRRHKYISLVFQLIVLSALVASCTVLTKKTQKDLPDTPITAIEKFARKSSTLSAHEVAQEVDVFLQKVDSIYGIPMIHDTTAVFLYRGKVDTAVFVAGDFTDWNMPADTFRQISGTDLYYRSFNFENDARLDYKLIVDGDWILDPLNDNTCRGGFGDNSELRMPNYPYPAEILPYEIPMGRMNTYEFSDSTTGSTHQVRVYTPPDYEYGESRYRTIYFHDGSDYLALGSTKKALDYMIYANWIPPVVAVFVDPIDRMREYSYDTEFMDMFALELVPWVEAKYRTQDNPEARAVIGSSLGGLVSLNLLLAYPEVFGNCGAYSPAVQVGDIIAKIENRDKSFGKIYLDAGSYEPVIYIPTLHLKHVLERRGWNLKWRQWHEGHSWGSWKAHLDESVTFFWPQSTEAESEI